MRQTGADPLLQFFQAAADARYRHAECGGSRSQSPLARDRQEDIKLGQRSASCSHYRTARSPIGSLSGGKLGPILVTSATALRARRPRLDPTSAAQRSTTSTREGL